MPASIATRPSTRSIQRTSPSKSVLRFSMNSSWRENKARQAEFFQSSRKHENGCPEVEPGTALVHRPVMVLTEQGEVRQVIRPSTAQPADVVRLA